MSLPRITYVIDDLGHGGAQRQLHAIARTLSGAGEISVVVLSEVLHPYAERIRALGVPVDVIARRTMFDAGRVLSLTRTFRRLRTEIAHAMLDASDGYTFLAARAAGIPPVLSLRSDRIHIRGARAAALGGMMRRAPAVTVNSEAGREHLVERVGVRAERVHLVRNIVDVPATMRDAAPDPPVIGAVGRIVEMKRFDAVLDALALVRRMIPRARAVIVGDGPARASLEARARRDDIAGAVELTGAVDDATAHIAAFSCLVVASTFEGLPNAALEALARGVPVVTVPAGDLPRVVRDGVSGAVARDASPAALADAIERVLTLPALRASAAQEGPRTVRSEYSAARAREQLLGLYARLQPAPK